MIPSDTLTGRGEKNSPPFYLWQGWLPIVIVIVAAIVPYIFVSNFQFISDDHSLIEDNILIKSNSIIPIFNRDFWSVTWFKGSGYYRPLTILSYWLQYHIFGVNPASYHIINILIHITNALFIFLLMPHIFSHIKKESWLVASILFAVHPIHIESVTFISGRTDLICTLFILLALFFYVVFRNRGKWWFLILFSFFYLFALLSKELGIVVPLIILGYEFLSSSTRWRRLLISFIPVIVVSMLYLIMRIQSITVDKFYTISAQFSMWERLLMSPYLFGKYILMMIIPYTYSPFYTIRVSDIWSTWIGGISVFLFLSYILFFIHTVRKRNFPVLLLLFSAFIVLLPVLQIIPTKGASFAERFAYLPSVFFFPAMVEVFALAKRRYNLVKRSWNVFWIVVLIGLSIITVIRNFYWSSDELYARRILQASPNSPIGHLYISVVFMQLGEFDSALVETRIVEKLVGSDTIDFRIPRQLGIIYGNLGERDSARKYFKIALDVAPENPMLMQHIGTFYANWGEKDSAIAFYKKAHKLDMGNAFISFQLAKALLVFTDDSARAETLLVKAVEDDPDLAKAILLLGNLYERKGNMEQAIDMWKRYLAIPGMEKIFSKKIIMKKITEYLNSNIDSTEHKKGVPSG